MSKRSERFDDLPVEFDRELIWEGIEKPTKPFPFIKPVLGTSLLVLVSGLAIWLGLFQQEAVESESITQSSSVDPHFKTPEKNDRAMGLSNKRKELLTTSGKDIAIAQHSVRLKHPKAHPFEHSTQVLQQIQHPSLNEHSFFALSRVDLKHFPTDDLFYAIPDSLTKSSLFKQKPLLADPSFVRFPFISLQAAGGTHLSQFISGDNGRVNRQTDLEQPQLDFHAGVNLGWLLKQNYTVSVGLDYALIKDRIQSSRFSYAENSLQRIDYLLYNHYHLLNTRIEVGKRFLTPNMFYDVRIGGTVNVLQKAELDYFDEFGALADKEASRLKYQNTSSVFATYRFGLGKVWNRSLNQNVFGTVGFMGNSPIQLTDKNADYQHRLVPMYLYAELGWEF